MFTQEELQNDFASIFEEVRQRSVEDFILSLLHIRRTPELRRLLQSNNATPVPTQFRFNVTPKSLHSITNVRSYTDYLDALNNVDELLRMYAKLYAYLQALETKYIYKVLGNFMRVLFGHKPKGDLFDNLHSGYQCYKKVIDLYNQVRQSGITFSLFPKWDTFMIRTLRNSIAHNDIFLDSQTRTVHLLSLQVDSVVHPNSVTRPRDIYTFDEVVDLYKSATNVSEAFQVTLSRHIDVGPRY